jgi:hypothetical protein
MLSFLLRLAPSSDGGSADHVGVVPGHAGADGDQPCRLVRPLMPEMFCEKNHFIISVT